MTTDHTPWLAHRDGRIPGFLYGTAWKETQTADLTRLALHCGFRGIDTANQRRHYHEAGVGEALKEVFSNGSLKRKDVFIQSKYTFVGGQDHRLPYQPEADIETQVHQSFLSSLDHLGIDYLDALILHGPMMRHGLCAEDRAAWGAMEALKQSGAVTFLGVSNVSASQLEELIDGAQVPPALVQNRCYARWRWDAGVRAVCRRHDILYQGFSLLTANQAELQHPLIQAAAQRYGVTVAQLVFAFARAIDMIPLTGTTRRGHMEQDLAALHIELTPQEISTIEAIAQL